MNGEADNSCFVSIYALGVQRVNTIHSLLTDTEEHVLYDGEGGESIT